MVPVCWVSKGPFKIILRFDAVKSLSIENPPESYNLVWTSRYQDLETRKDEQSFDKVIMGIRCWRYQFISLYQTITALHFAWGWRYDIRLCPRVWLTGEGVIQMDCQKRNAEYTLSQAPVIRISLSPDPTRLSQKVRLVTGPVWPLKVERVFPVYTGLSSKQKPINLVMERVPLDLISAQLSCFPQSRQSHRELLSPAVSHEAR